MKPHFQLVMKYSLPCLLLLLILGACSRGNREVNASLDYIEAVVQQHPDSALLELVKLDSLLDSGTLRIEGECQHARYALLKTQTHDKNYIDDTNDSLILQAVRYYDDHGSKRERMLVHFYHGAIFRNAKDYGAAFFAYRQAENYAQELGDDYYLTRIYGNLFSLSHDTYSQDAIMYARKNIEYARKSGDVREAFQAKADMARNYSTRLIYDTAEVLFRQVLDSLPASDPIVQYCLTPYIEQCISSGKIQLADSMLSLLTSITLPINLLNKACLYQIKGMSDSADVFVQRAKQSIKTPNQQVFYYEKLSWIAEMRGDLATSIAYKRKRNIVQNEVITSIFAKSVSDYQRDFELQQKEHAEYRIAEYRRWSALVAALCLLLIAGGAAYIWKKRKEKQRIIDEYMENVLDLRQTLLQQTNTISELNDRISSINSEHLNQEMGQESQDKKVFAKGFKELNSLCMIYFDSKGKSDEKRIIYEKVRSLIKNFSKPSKQNELELLIDANLNNAMEKAKAPEINLTDEELQLFRYRVAGFTNRSICLLMQINNPDTVKKRVQRLRSKIVQSDSRFKDYLADLI